VTAPAATDLALLLQTSGTTSRPKVVPLSHANLLASARSVAEVLALGPRDRSLAAMPLFHIHGIVASLLAPLVAGGSVICCRSNAPQALLAALESLKPTWLSAVPTLLQGLLAELDRTQHPLPPHQLRFLRSSSSPLPPPVLERLEVVFRVPVIEAYGMTEAAHQICSNRLPGAGPGGQPGSVGAAAGPEVAVLGADRCPLPAGESGEVAIRGVNVTEGYEAADQSGWVHDASGDAWFLTGDEGLMDGQGRLTLTGRLKEMINRGGEKVIPRRVDEVLLGHPAVEQALAFAVPHPTLGEDLAAAVVLRAGAVADEQDLRGHAFSQLAPYEVPSRILLLESLPRGATGKLQRIGLAEKLGAILFPADEPLSGELEELMAHTFADMLQQPPPPTIAPARMTALNGSSIPTDDAPGTKREYAPQQAVSKKCSERSCLLVGEGKMLAASGILLRQAGIQISGVISDDGTAQQWAKSLGLRTAGHGPDLVAWLESTPVDYLLSVINPRILPLEALRLPRIAAINFHRGPLPRYAGLHATSWALINGEKTYGVTWHLMDPSIDTGAIVRQRSFDVVEDETALSLNLKCFTVGLSLLEELLPDLAQGTIKATQQGLSLRSYFAGSRRPTAGGILDWGRPGEESQAMARATDFGPYFNPLVLPKIWTGKECLIVREVKLGNMLVGGLPGTVLAIDQASLTIATASRPLSLGGLATIDGEPLSVAEAARRYHLCIGLLLPGLSRQRVAQVTSLSEKVARHEQFWSDRLQSLQTVSLLGKPRATQIVKGGAMVSMAWRVPEEVDGWLDRYGNPCKLDGFLLAAFGAFLAQFGGQDRFDVEFFDGSAEATESCGIFARHVPFCFKIDDDFLGILEQVCLERACIARHLTYPRDLVPRSPGLRDRVDLCTGSKLAIAVEIEPIEKDAGFGHDLVMRFPRDGREGMAVFEAGSSVSMSMIVKRFLSFVRNLAAGDGADYAAWQRQRLSGERLQELNDYWIGQLRDLEPLELPSDHPRPVTPSYRGESVCFQIEPALLEPFEGLCRREGATLQMGLLAVVALLLHRYSRQEDFAIGVPIWGRNHPELENLIGFFINTLPIRTRFEREQSFRELLVQVRDRSIGAYDHQELPFEQMVEALNLPRDTSRNPLVQVMLQLIELPEAGLEQLDGLAVQSLPSRSDSVKLDLSFYLRRSADQGLSAAITYATDLFNGDRIERLTGHLLTLLASVVQAPDTSADALNLLPEAESQLIKSWQQGPRIDVPDLCVHQLFEQQVERTPEAIALVFEEQQLTYAELNARANQLAHHLIDQGVGPELIVAVCIERSVQLIVALLAILKAGGAFLPLPTNQPAARIGNILTDSGSCWILLSDSLDHGYADVSPVDARPILISRLFDASGPDHNPKAGAKSSHLAYLLPTSGTTGRPKTVAVDHSSIVNRCCTYPEVWGLDQRSRVLFQSDLWHDSASREWLLPLTCGASVLVASQQDQQDPARLFALVSSRGCTHLAGTPSRLETLIGVTSLGPVTVTAGGETLSQSLADRLFGADPSRLMHSFGSTETCLACEFHDVPRLGSKDLETQSGTRIPIGRPLSNTSLHVLDEGGLPCPISILGELHIGGAGLARGYLHDPALTAATFIAHPFCSDPAARLYKSGDLAAWNADGTLTFHGRIDQQIKLRGFRIEPGEIEAHLHAHPAVARAVVVLRHDDPDHPRLIAYWVRQTTTATPIATEQLRSFLAQRLPDSMVPSAFVELEALPLTSTGKLDRRALPAPSFSVAPEQRVEPSTDLEQHLHALWAEVLGHGDFGIHDNFFQVGGHSLAAARLIAALNDQLSIRLPIATIFHAPEIGLLADLLGRSSVLPAAIDPCFVPLQREGRAAPLFVIHGYAGDVFCYTAFADAMAPTRPVYGLQARGVDGHGERHRSLQEMAEHYADLIERHRPEGVVHLLGQSAGGWYTWAVASVLVSRGRSIGTVAILDSGPTAAISARLRASLLARRTARRLPTYLHLLRHSKRPRNLLAFLQERQRNLAAHLQRFRELPAPLPQEAATAHGVHKDPPIDYFLRLCQRYRPQPQPLRVHLLTSRHEARLKYHRWRAMACGGVVVRQLFEEHHHFHTASLADQLATAIAEILEQVGDADSRLHPGHGPSPPGRSSL
jgi:amino acid adenylation domain-containing protein